MTNQEILVIDVRSPGEYSSGHVQGSINLPLDRVARDIGQLAPDKRQQIILCCATGGRSGMACSLLQQQGYAAVSNGGGAHGLAARLGRALVPG